MQSSDPHNGAMVSATTRRSDGPLPTHIGLLLRLAHQAHAAVWERLVSSTTTTVQFGALSYLSRHPGASQQDLSEAMDLDRSTVAAIASRLERQRHIQRERDAQDRRRNRLVLTDLGRDVLTQLTPLVIAEENSLAGGLTEAERDQLRTLLRKLLAHTWAIRELTHNECEE